MEMLNWIDKNLSDIQSTLLYGKYFDSIHFEKGVDVYYLLNPLKGVDLILTETYYIKSIHFYSGNQIGTNQFVDDLPFNLHFSFSREQTMQILGAPMETGGGGYSFLYGTTPFWDKYQHNDFYLHLQFTEDCKSIDLITIDSKSQHQV